MSLWSPALLHALRYKIIKNFGAWLNRKDSQSLRWETGIHEAIVSKGGISLKGQSSLTPQQVKNIPSGEPENFTGAREGQAKTQSIPLRQGHLYGCCSVSVPMGLTSNNSKGKKSYMRKMRKKGWRKHWS